MTTDTPTLPTRRVQRVRHELRRRELTVLRTEPLGPGFVAITFGGEALADFVSLGFDDHVKFILPGDTPDAEPMRRDYTPRRFDAARRELTIEFALHGHGAASDWARQARPGDAATIGGPRGSMVVPTDYDWHLLVGDATALPAVHRRLEELPAGTRAIVRLLVAEADRRPLTSAATLDLQWLDTPELLLQALQAQPLPAGEG
ncbi:MAG: siderophore-interacting protein, partial [Aquincola sp.]|nr:siderophore-interacting protein [Aquincola sp.]